MSCGVEGLPVAFASGFEFRYFLAVCKSFWPLWILELWCLGQVFVFSLSLIIVPGEEEARSFLGA